jgi:hypothetical protein
MYQERHDDDATRYSLVVSNSKTSLSKTITTKSMLFYISLDSRFVCFVIYSSTCGLGCVSEKTR